jgi:hypothetical protein
MNSSSEPSKDFRYEVQDCRELVAAKRKHLDDHRSFSTQIGWDNFSPLNVSYSQRAVYRVTSCLTILSLSLYSRDGTSIVVYYLPYYLISEVFRIPVPLVRRINIKYRCFSLEPHVQGSYWILHHKLFHWPLSMSWHSNSSVSRSSQITFLPLCPRMS